MKGQLRKNGEQKRNIIKYSQNMTQEGRVREGEKLSERQSEIHSE